MSSNGTVVRHRGGSRSTRRDSVKSISADSLPALRPTLLRVVLAVRDLSAAAVSAATGLGESTLHRLLTGDLSRAPHAETLSVLSAYLTATLGRGVSEPQVLELVRRRVCDPDKASDEIQEALAAATNKAR